MLLAFSWHDGVPTMEDNNFNESEVATELEVSDFTLFFNSFLCTIN